MNKRRMEKLAVLLPQVQRQPRARLVHKRTQHIRQSRTWLVAFAIGAGAVCLCGLLREFFM
jgi:hypothetical protein